MIVYEPMIGTYKHCRLYRKCSSNIL